MSMGSPPSFATQVPSADLQSNCARVIEGRADPISGLQPWGQSHWMRGQVTTALSTVVTQPQARQLTGLSVAEISEKDSLQQRAAFYRHVHN
jgi:hypothetical protein